MPKLQINLPDGLVTHELADDSATVGRLPDNTIEIADVSVSSHHAELTLRGSDYILRDIGSTNGTKVNGRKLEAETDYSLKNGDSVRFGNIDCHYESETASDNMELPPEEEPAAVLGDSSSRPADFKSESPFEKRKTKQDPVAMAIMAVTILAILAGLGAIAVSATTVVSL